MNIWRGFIAEVVGSHPTRSIFYYDGTTPLGLAQSYFNSSIISSGHCLMVRGIPRLKLLIRQPEKKKVRRNHDRNKGDDDYDYYCYYLLKMMN
jgi:hypothetical protein